MNFFGMGPLELLVVLVLALVFLGPEKLPEIAAQLGKLYRDIRRMTNELSAELNESMQEIQSIQQSFDLGLEERVPQPPTSSAQAPIPVPDAPNGTGGAVLDAVPVDAAVIAQDAAAFEPAPAAASEAAAAVSDDSGELGLSTPSASAVATVEPAPVPVASSEPAAEPVNGQRTTHPPSDDLAPPY